MKKTLTSVLVILAVIAPLAGPALSQREAQREYRLAGLRKMPRGLTEAKVKAHVMKPAHTRNIVAEKEEDLEPAFDLKQPTVQYGGGSTPKLNVTKFATFLDSVLKSSTAGYALEIRQNGTPIYGLVRGYAHRPADGRLGWTGDIRMHVASVSKLMTAIGMVKLLDSKGLSLDDKIIGHLPAYWSKGANINKITFRHLLKHRSGLGVLPLVGGGESSASDFAFMKENIRLGAVEPGSKSVYQNVNYGLMRILISVINGDIDNDYDPGPFRDVIWDSLTIGFYKDYMQDRVFTPAGVANAGFAPLPFALNSALAYNFPPGNGWNSGDLATVSGGAGWRLSVKEVLNVMDHFRRRNTIVSSTRAQQILDAAIGLNNAGDTPAGKMYYKKGRWTNSGRTEQCVAYFLPENMEMMVVVNSKIFLQGFSLHKLVRDIYNNSLE